MDKTQRFPAFLAYLLPVISWIYLAVFQRKNRFAIFHMRQSIGLFLFVILITLAWGLASWLLAWIPYAIILAVVLFTFPLVAYIFSAIAWIIGMINALRNMETPLPMIGGYSSRLPI
jgi:uncharacterized membrane protein